MSRLFYQTMQDNAGNLLFDVSGTMRIAGSGTLATIYGDEALTVILPNPMTNHPSFGSFKCFLGAGDYDFYMAKAGYTFETLTGVQGHGTLAQQDANAVAITGGSIAGISPLEISGAATLYSTLIVNGAARFNNAVGLNVAPPVGTAALAVRHLHASQYGLLVGPLDSDTGPSAAVQFINVSNVGIGSITLTASATAFNTTSDARLKRDIASLDGALDVIRALNPVSFLWQEGGTPGRGFLAHEVQAVIPDGVITGERDALDEAGQVLPQQIDHSKLVPWLVAAVKELTQQVEMLQAQLAAASA